MEGLIYYLFGPGRHADLCGSSQRRVRPVWTPREVAGWRHPAELEPPQRPDGRRDFRWAVSTAAASTCSEQEFFALLASRSGLAVGNSPWT